MSVLKINGTEMPSISGLSITRERIWSKNTGRTADGVMRGDIITKKWKIQVTFTPMSDEKAKLLENAISPAFFDVTFLSPESGAMETVTMYAGSSLYKVYSYVDGLPRYVGNAVDLIEQ